ncbi:hypothetical protein KO481_08410 [Nocardia sp. NEAU-G5]|uniref:WXG100 family type VII secretion target n=1 Tax=Nocardia albiluteola TaxID=2842303 RepID=A0ABS6AX31_9NOCA|nr:hypothetical protein [Nocardia albiluteola]MBU3061544.1 hypothetical protein [Nocardia albiluteola]
MVTVDASTDLHGTNPDTILDNGSSGLQYFKQLIDHYTKAFGAPSLNMGQIYNRYDEQRGMDLNKLANTADGLRTALGDVDTQWDAQKKLSQQLPTIWTGTASEAAQHMFGQQITMADSDRGKARDALNAIGTAIPLLRKAVQDKADTVHGMADSAGNVTVHGKTPDEIGKIVETATGKWYDSSTAEVVIGVLSEGMSVPFSAANNIVSKQLAEHWVNTVFKPDFDNNFTSFTNACTATDTAVKNAYTTLVSAMNEVNARAYPRPAGTTSTPNNNTNNNNTNNNTTSGNTTGGNTTSSSPSSTTTTPSTTTSPTNTTTSSFDPSSLVSTALNGLGTFTSDISSLGQTLAQDASTLGTQIQQGVQGVVSQVENLFKKDVSGSTDNSPKLEFDIAGKHVKLALGKNGEVDLSTSDGSGDSKSYSMKLDEHGLPVITSTDGTTTDNNQSGADAQKSEGAADTSQKSGGSGSGGGGASSDNSGGTQSSTGISTPTVSGGDSDKDKKTQTQAPTPTPTQEQPATPVTGTDSGAELAEAGPL